MNKEVTEFLETVCQQVKSKEVHQALSEELRSHILDQMETYMETGMPEEEAVLRAVKQMGDPVEIGRNLHKTHRPKTEWSIILLIGALVLIGGGTLFSIARNELLIGFFAKRYFLYTLIGIGTCIACYYFDYTRLENYALTIYGGTLLFLLIASQSPYSIQGVIMIRVGSFNLSPVSIVLPFFLISFAGLLGRYGTGNIMGMLKLLGLAVAAMALCMIYPSFPSAMLLGSGFLVMLTIAIMDTSFTGNRRVYLFSIYGGSLAGVVLILITSSKYLRARLFSFLNYQADPLGMGYQHSVANRILSQAKLFGRGEGLYTIHKGRAQFTLPGVNTEFIFTYLIGTFGWLAGILVVILIALAIVRMLMATRSIHHRCGKYMASAIITVFTLQALGNILMNFALFPITSFSLPFISYGGANFTVNMALVGLLLGIYRRKDLISAEVREG